MVLPRDTAGDGAGAGLEVLSVLAVVGAEELSMMMMLPDVCRTPTNGRLALCRYSHFLIHGIIEKKRNENWKMRVMGNSK